MHSMRDYYDIECKLAILCILIFRLLPCEFWFLLAFFKVSEHYCTCAVAWNIEKFRFGTIMENNCHRDFSCGRGTGNNNVINSGLKSLRHFKVANVELHPMSSCMALDASTYFYCITGLRVGKSIFRQKCAFPFRRDFNGQIIVAATTAPLITPFPALN